MCFRFVFCQKLRADGGLDLSGYKYDNDDGDLSVNDGDAVVSYIRYKYAVSISIPVSVSVFAYRTSSLDNGGCTFMCTNIYLR